MNDWQEYKTGKKHDNNANISSSKAEKGKRNGTPSKSCSIVVIKDILIYGTYIILLVIATVFIVLEQIKSHIENPWHILFSIAGVLTILTLFFVCMLDLLYEHNLMFAVPNSYIQHKEQRKRAAIKRIMFAVLDAQSKYFSMHDEEIIRRELALIDKNTDYTLSSMRAVELRNSGLFSIEDAKQKLKDLVFKSDIVQDISATPEAHLTPGLRYYIRFPDLMYDEHSRALVTNIASTYIAHLYDDEAPMKQLSEAARSFISSPVLDNLDVIATPNNGNYLLGYDISKLLRKDHIKIITPEKIINKNTYEGVIHSKKTSPNVLIVHDVLATGKQIIESIDSLREACPNIQIMGVLTLIYRRGGDSERDINRRGIPLFPLLSMSEEEIAQELAATKAQ